ncbi:long-chain fatty acid--CoA ligase [Gottfriedia sp. NPDC056225]|uniref:long-chain-fatty-acid--CoA ligase n=1 Tax=Gottfriedia sp. NPDC056225 TaxID=3345751 RepID=UPI0035DA9562
MNKPWLANYPEEVSYKIDIPSLTILEVLDQAAKENPSKIGIIDGDRKTTFLQLKKACERVAYGLYKRGFKKGDRIAVMLPNCLEYAIAFFAVQRLGGVVVQINPYFKPEELKHILNNSESVGLIAFREVKEKLDKVGMIDKVKFITADEVAKEDDNIHLWIENEKAELPSMDLQSNDLAIILYTGGTTGFPKGVMIKHSNMAAALYQGNECSKPILNEEGHCQIGIAPLYHGLGLFTLVQSIFIGASFVMVRNFDLDYILTLIRTYRPTIFMGSPTMYIALLNHPDLLENDLSCFKLCVCGAAPVPVEILNRFEEKTGVPIIEGYGLSEATIGVTRNPVNGKRKVGSIGIPLPNTDVKIVDIATGTKEMQVGEPGELIVKGPQVMKGYWKNQEESDYALRDGWLHTGDMATMDNEGYFYIVGRKKEMIITGGFNVYPAEVEEVIYKHPAVLEACVYGIPDPYRIETVKLAVVLKKGYTLTSEEIREWCKERLTNYKVPRIIEFKESLPKTPVGKIMRLQLKNEDVQKTEMLGLQ